MLTTKKISTPVIVSGMPFHSGYACYDANNTLVGIIEWRYDWRLYPVTRLRDGGPRLERPVSECFESAARAKRHAEKHLEELLSELIYG